MYNYFYYTTCFYNLDQLLKNAIGQPQFTDGAFAVLGPSITRIMKS